MLITAAVNAGKRYVNTPEDNDLSGFDRLKAVRSKIPAVTHVVDSARVQTVNTVTNPRYYRLLTEFKALTGCPGLVNTSFMLAENRSFARQRTHFSDSRGYAAQGKKGDRLLDLLNKTGATHYISGPAARAYIDPSAFVRQGIHLSYKNYSGYPEYPQRFTPFDHHHVSIVDLLFQLGPEAPNYIWQ